MEDECISLNNSAEGEEQNFLRYNCIYFHNVYCVENMVSVLSYTLVSTKG